MKHKTSELEGALLDAAVAKADGIELTDGPHDYPAAWDADIGCWRGWSACRDWRIGGPIIERERIAIMGDDETGWVAGWQTSSDSEEVPDTFRRVAGECWQTGRTALIAAMRAYVASKLGEEVKLP